MPRNRPPPPPGPPQLSLELALDLLMPSLIVNAELEADELQRAAYARLVSEVESNRAAFRQRAEAMALERALASERRP